MAFPSYDEQLAVDASGIPSTSYYQGSTARQALPDHHEKPTSFIQDLKNGEQRLKSSRIIASQEDFTISQSPKESLQDLGQVPSQWSMTTVPDTSSSSSETKTDSQKVDVGLSPISVIEPSQKALSSKDATLSSQTLSSKTEPSTSKQLEFVIENRIEGDRVRATENKIIVPDPGDGKTLDLYVKTESTVKVSYSAKVATSETELSEQEPLEVSVQSPLPLSAEENVSTSYETSRSPEGSGWSAPEAKEQDGILYRDRKLNLISSDVDDFSERTSVTVSPIRDQVIDAKQASKSSDSAEPIEKDSKPVIFEESRITDSATSPIRNELTEMATETEKRETTDTASSPIESAATAREMDHSTSDSATSPLERSFPPEKVDAANSPLDLEIRGLAISTPRDKTETSEGVFSPYSDATLEPGGLTDFSDMADVAITPTDRQPVTFLSSPEIAARPDSLFGDSFVQEVDDYSENRPKPIGYDESFDQGDALKINLRDTKIDESDVSKSGTSGISPDLGDERDLLNSMDLSLTEEAKFTASLPPPTVHLGTGDFSEGTPSVLSPEIQEQVEYLRLTIESAKQDHQTDIQIEEDRVSPLFDRSSKEVIEELERELSPLRDIQVKLHSKTATVLGVDIANGSPPPVIERKLSKSLNGKSDYDFTDFVSKDHLEEKPEEILVVSRQVSKTKSEGSREGTLDESSSQCTTTDRFFSLEDDDTGSFKSADSCRADSKSPKDPIKMVQTMEKLKCQYDNINQALTKGDIKAAGVSTEEEAQALIERIETEITTLELEIIDYEEKVLKRERVPLSEEIPQETLKQVTGHNNVAETIIRDEGSISVAPSVLENNECLGAEWPMPTDRFADEVKVERDECNNDSVPAIDLEFGMKEGIGCLTITDKTAPDSQRTTIDEPEEEDETISKDEEPKPELVKTMSSDLEEESKEFVDDLDSTQKKMKPKSSRDQYRMKKAVPQVTFDFASDHSSSTDDDDFRPNVEEICSSRESLVEIIPEEPTIEDELDEQAAPSELPDEKIKVETSEPSTAVPEIIQKSFSPSLKSEEYSESDTEMSQDSIVPVATESPQKGVVVEPAARPASIERTEPEDKLKEGAITKPEAVVQESGKGKRELLEFSDVGCEMVVENRRVSILAADVSQIHVDRLLELSNHMLNISDLLTAVDTHAQADNVKVASLKPNNESRPTDQAATSQDNTGNAMKYELTDRSIAMLRLRASQQVLPYTHSFGLHTKLPLDIQQPVAQTAGFHLPSPLSTISNTTFNISISESSSASSDFDESLNGGTCKPEVSDTESFKDKSSDLTLTLSDSLSETTTTETLPKTPSPEKDPFKSLSSR